MTNTYVYPYFVHKQSSNAFTHPYTTHKHLEYPKHQPTKLFGSHRTWKCVIKVTNLCNRLNKHVKEIELTLYWCLHRHHCDLPERFGKKDRLVRCIAKDVTSRHRHQWSLCPCPCPYQIVNNQNIRVSVPKSGDSTDSRLKSPLDPHCEMKTYISFTSFKA